MTPEQTALRTQYLTVAVQLLTAEREVLLRDFLSRTSQLLNG